MTHERSDGPRILIENSEYWLANLGDLAMLDVTLRRLRDCWPDAQIGVLTDSALLLRAYFPTAEPIVPTGTRSWYPPGVLERLCGRLGPRVVGPVVVGWLRTRAMVTQKARGAVRRSRALVARRPDPAALPSAPRLGAPATRRRPHDNTIAALETTSLVVTLGGGYLADADPAQAHRVFSVLDHAQRHGIPTVLLGQGLGPLEEPRLLEHAASVLPRTDLIALREGRRGPALLARAGVSPSRFTVTGDDAVELGYAARRDRLGDQIGICLRATSYSPVDASAQEHLREALHLFARETGSPLSPLFVAEYRSQDRRSTLPLVKGFESITRPLPRYSRPQDLARAVAACRIVVTGAYHAAVFALAQGIPVVALSTTEYYDDKFGGLRQMFEAGIVTVTLDDSAGVLDLSAAMRTAWTEAAAVRDPLRLKAAEQIESSRSALVRAAELVRRFDGSDD